MKKAYQLLAVLWLAVILIACQKEETVAPIQSETGSTSASFGSRITYINKPIQLTAQKSNSSDHYWEYVAKVDAPVFQGKRLSATHIALQDDYAYVSYNLYGDEHKGGVEVVNLTNKSFPTLAAQAYFDNMDINAIAADPDGSLNSRKLWLAGSHEGKGAVLREILLSNGLLSSNVTDVNLSKAISTGISASANGVVKAGNNLYVTSGKTHGGSYCLSLPNLNVQSNESFSNAKYIATNASENTIAALVTGNNASLKTYAPLLASPSSFGIEDIVHQNVQTPYRGKSTLHFAANNDNICYVASATNGLLAYNIQSGDTVVRSLASMLKRGNCNSVTSDVDYLYLANGADGLAIADLPSTGDLNVLFTWDMADQPASANYITADGEWVFIAKGNGGFVILRKKEAELQSINGHDNQGVPDGMEPDKVVCSTLLPNIYSYALPEGQNAIVNKPQYFGQTIKELYLKDTADVYLTFVNEGAGYRNVLGYYYYDKNNPPQSANDLNKTVIFPNCSAQGSGGGLIQGNTMRLLGSFDANTVIGFFLIANGWRNGGITGGLYTHYTDPRFNVDQEVQSILFHDTTCTSTVIAFEDIAVQQGGDKDFNDAIFEISANPPSAIEVTSLIEI